jgi:NADP-dependent 3-hydroxy acid dehydrogenase YdfG
MQNLQGRTAIITGASSGIGRACARYLAQNGVHLILTGRRTERLNDLASELHQTYAISVTPLSFDITDKEAVNQNIEPLLEERQINILINNAGLALDASKIDACDTDDWEQMIDTNIKGLLYISRPVIAHMRQNNSGHIINLGSIAGKMTYPGGNVYCATKSAVHTLGEAMNVDLVGTPIRVSTIAPGAVETEFSNVRFKGDQSAADTVYEGFEPLCADDIADLILYVLQAPSHVNIQHTLIMPTAQRNPYTLHREPKF